MNVRGFALGFALVLPLTVLGTADAAPRAHTGSFSVNVAASEFPVTFPGYGNEDVRSVRFDVTSAGFKSTDRLLIGLDCRDATGASVYATSRTVTPTNTTLSAYAVSFYVSTAPAWTGQAAVCDAELFWQSWNRRTLYQFGGVLQSAPAMFVIGAA